jgi:hypothetical protein
MEVDTPSKTSQDASQNLPVRDKRFPFVIHKLSIHNYDLTESLKISNALCNFVPDGIPVGPGGIVARIGEWTQKNFINCFIVSTQVDKGVNMGKNTSSILSFYQNNVASAQHIADTVYTVQVHNEQQDRLGSLVARIVSTAVQ